MKKTSHVIDILFPVILFFVFAISAISIIILASNIYQNTVNASSRNYSSEIILSYISEKIHQNDENGGVSIVTVEDQNVLKLENTVNEVKYITYIYAQDQELKELYFKKGTTVSLENGKSIVEIEDLLMEEYHSIFTFTCTDTNGKTETIKVSTQSE